MSLLLAAGSVAPQAGSPWYLWQVRIQRDDPDAIVPPAISYQALYGRTTPAGQTGGAPWYLWQPSPRPLDAPQEPMGADLGALHRYRTGYQTVGQPVWSLYWRSSVPDIPPPPDGASYAPSAHLYRVGYQTVGQPAWSLYWRGARPQELEQPIAPVLPLFYRQIVTTVSPGQTWLMWPGSPKPVPDPEPVYTVNYGQYMLFWGRTVTVPPGPVPHYEINLGLSLSRLGGKF